MTGRPKKHSLTLRGHSTSVTLEDEFWQAFREIAEAEGSTINALAARIDDQRRLELGLASALRLHVLRHYQSRLRVRDAQTSGTAAPKQP